MKPIEKPTFLFLSFLTLLSARLSAQVPEHIDVGTHDSSPFPEWVNGWVVGILILAIILLLLFVSRYVRQKKK